MNNPVTATFVLIFALAVSSLANGESPASGLDSPVTLKQDTTRIKATPGAPIQIQVRGNSGTGYVWSLSQIDAQHIKVLSTASKPVGDMPGAAEFTIFSLEPLIKGTSVLEFTYKRPWEKTPVRTYKVIVETIR